MKYGIYDASLDVWVKTSFLEFNTRDGIPVTENKSEALSSEHKEKIDTLLETLKIAWERKGKGWMTKPMEVREL
jgi:hypothetical protein